MQKGSALERRAVQVGTRRNLNDLCGYIQLLFFSRTNINSRTYGRNAGEDIREGYEPTNEATVDEFVVGEDDESRVESEESRQWKEANSPEVLLKPKYGLDGEAFENVWTGGEPSETPKENP